MFKDKLQDWAELIEEEKFTVKAKKDLSKGKRASNIKDVEVDALHKSGDWAAHLPVGLKDKTKKGSYAITHIPSGLAAKFISNKKEAIKLVNALGKMSVKWDGKGKPPQDFLDQAKEIVKK